MQYKGTNVNEKDAWPQALVFIAIMVAVFALS